MGRVSLRIFPSRRRAWITLVVVGILIIGYTFNALGFLFI